MNQSHNYPLQAYNSFNVEAFSEHFYQPENIADLVEISDILPHPYYILGEGTNTLFFHKTVPTVISPKFYGKTIVEHDNYFQVTASASENWHELVKFCIERGAYGLENLALIPGTVGAAPVQNIGAYGVEFANYCYQVKWFDFESKKIIVMDTEKCRFAYRESVFKHHLNGKGIIVEVSLRLPKDWQPCLSYHGLDSLSPEATAEQVMARVIKIRQEKLPDPLTLPNAGSFFKNPIISIAAFNELQQQYSEIPFYNIDDHNIKLAAGWLIEHTGLKGYQQNGVGVHKQQALVLVNFSSADGEDILTLAKYIVAAVNTKFGIMLEPEVRLVGPLSEQAFSELCNHG